MRPMKKEKFHQKPIFGSRFPKERPMSMNKDIFVNFAINTYTYYEPDLLLLFKDVRGYRGSYFLGEIPNFQADVL